MNLLWKRMGIALARRLFDARSKGRTYRTTEAHLREDELAEMFAIAAEHGARHAARALKEAAEVVLRQVSIGVDGAVHDPTASIGESAFNAMKKAIKDMEGK